MSPKKQFTPIDTGIDTVAEQDRSVTENISASTPKGIHVKIRSKQLTTAFRPVKLFLQVFCNFPFASKLQIDGTVYYVSHVYDLSYICVVNVITAFFATVVFFYVAVGLITSSIASLTVSNETNMCNQTWEIVLFYQCMAPLAVAFNSLALLFIGCVHLFFYGKDFIRYYNYWNRAVQIMNMDVTYRVFRKAMLGHSAFCFLVIMYIFMYAFSDATLMDRTCAALANAFTRFWKPDIYKGSFEKGMTEKDYKYHERVCSITGEPDGTVFKPVAATYSVAKICGLILLIAGLYGIRSYVCQFSFYCRVLRNASYIWNERLKNYFMKEKVDLEDQTRFRLDPRSLIQDHLILVRLFKMTETNFVVVLQMFYFFQMVNLVIIMYGFYLIGNVTSCHDFWKLVEDFVLNKPPPHPMTGKCPSTNNIMDYPDEATRFSFDRPCVKPEKEFGHNAIFLIILLIQCIVSLIQMTTVAAAAYEEAMRGWQILRKNGFMNANAPIEKNFIHSLNISFARDNPLEISAGFYFVVNRTLLVIMLVTILVHFTTLVQFQPGIIQFDLKCVQYYNSSHNRTTRMDVYREASL